jgi:hypothetical protein
MFISSNGGEDFHGGLVGCDDMSTCRCVPVLRGHLEKVTVSIFRSDDLCYTFVRNVGTHPEFRTVSQHIRPSSTGLFMP